MNKERDKEIEQKIQEFLDSIPEVKGYYVSLQFENGGKDIAKTDLINMCLLKERIQLKIAKNMED